MKYYNHTRNFSSVNFIVVLGLLLQTFTPLIAALQQTSVHYEMPDVRGGEVDASPSYVDLADFDVEQLVIHVVEDAVESDSYTSLSSALLICYKTIIEGQSKVDADVLIEAMPELLQYAMLHEHMRAPRPDAPSGLANNAISACGGNCDLTQVIRLLASIRGRIGTVKDSPCCDTILGILGDACNVPCIGEDGSISEVLCEILDCCTSVVADVKVVFTVLADLKETLTECCADLKETITECCADLKDTLTDCCAELKQDIFDTQTLLCDKFEQTWTILADIESKLDNFPSFTFIVTATVEFVITVTVDLSGVFTAIADVKDTLTDCCDDIKSDIFDTQTLLCDKFEQTWTILAGLNFDCSTTVVIDLNGVFTAIADVKDTVTDCCADLKDTLTDCCDDIKSDIFDTQTLICDKFEQTWTILAGLNFDCSTTVVIDLNGVFTAIADVKDTLTDCCDDIKSDIFDTQTLLCDKFEQTWTILADLSLSISALDVELSGVFTVIADLDACCCNPITILPSDVLASTFTISTPGYYVFLDDITFSPASAMPAILITSSNVRLDLCGKSLIQGNATAGVDGIVVSGGTAGSPRENVVIQSGSVKSFTRVGVVVGTNSVTPADTACSRVTISDIDTVSCAIGGIEILGTSGAEVREMVVQNCRVISCCTDTAATRVGLNAQRIIDGRFDGIDINQNGVGGLALLYGFNLQNCQKCFVNQVTMLMNAATTMEGLRVDTVINSFINLINIVGNSVETFTGVRFVGTTSGNTLGDSSVNDNTSTTGALKGYSFEITTTLNTIRTNVAMNNLSTGTGNCIGFNFDQVSSYNVIANRASFNRALGLSELTSFAAGFFIGTTGVGTTGVKNSTFIDNFAISNDGNTSIDGERSYGFNVVSLAGGNTGNAYVNNNAIRNGGTASDQDFQIVDDAGPAPANPGGVPNTSIRDRSLSQMNSQIHKLVNLRLV